MEDVDTLLKWTDDLKKEISQLSFQENDIRRDFYGLLFDVTYNSYISFAGQKLFESIKDGDVILSDKLSISDKHVERLMEASIFPIRSRSQRNYLNRHLLIDAWSNFELCTTFFVEAICKDDELENLLGHHFRDIYKCISKSNLNENERENLLKLTRKTHLTHVPITRKTDFLFKRAINYYRDAQKDKEFLIFLGRFRNTIHTNFIYYGKDFEYRFGHAHFKFENSKLVKWIDPFEPSPKLYFYLLGQLKDIWTVFVNAINHDSLIPYPDLEQE
ncbi:hypothetical protein JN11_00876 [Mucilaginibacter frigoritolerans]|uniref:Uncharacterized protein n=1 Tax=Mucilaginibacter frigoritolerans TaxID=652788 RepID=A0A562UC35_9SPHI|nr:hypothetical protein [Mucilaginibacter frigoritolerans]TWJ03338.1 hypothetical protein JN11_00876 [Mucilaginibacter frigoritolerans]